MMISTDVDKAKIATLIPFYRRPLFNRWPLWIRYVHHCTVVMVSANAAKFLHLQISVEIRISRQGSRRCIFEANVNKLTSMPKGEVLVLLTGLARLSGNAYLAQTHLEGQSSEPF